jgi:rhomboid protease GluP
LRELGISVNDSDPQYLATIVTECAASAPEPWYPSDYVRKTGILRETLDPYLDRLRMGGLIQLTDWVEGKGQGYALTQAGAEVLGNQRQLARLRAGEVRGPASLPRPIADPGAIVPLGWERAEAVRTAFLSHTTPVVTYGLIAVNVLWFVYGLALASREGIPPQDYLFNTDIGVIQVLHQIGSLRGGDIYVHHEWWRLLTCCFVHIGFFHLAVNMYSLFVVGPLLERLWGRIGFLVLYLIAGVGGSCGMLIGIPLGGGAGASGAIWGVLASLATWLFLNRAVLPRQLITSMQRQLLTIFLLNVLITFGVSQISKGAHFGGGLVGLLTAVPLDTLRFGKGRQWWTALAALVMIPTVSIAGAVISLNRAGESLAAEEFDERYIGPVRVVAKEVRATLLDDAEPLLSKDSGDRAAEDVEKVVAKLVRQRDELTRLKKQLDNADTPADEKIVELRQKVSKTIDGIVALLDSVQNRLRRGEGLSGEERQLLQEFMKATGGTR